MIGDCFENRKLKSKCHSDPEQSVGPALSEVEGEESSYCSLHMIASAVSNNLRSQKSAVSTNYTARHEI